MRAVTDARLLPELVVEKPAQVELVVLWCVFYPASESTCVLPLRLLVAARQPVSQSLSQPASNLEPRLACSLHLARPTLRAMCSSAQWEAVYAQERSWSRKIPTHAHTHSDKHEQESIGFKTK